MPPNGARPPGRRNSAGQRRSKQVIVLPGNSSDTDRAKKKRCIVVLAGGYSTCACSTRSTKQCNTADLTKATAKKTAKAAQPRRVEEGTSIVIFSSFFPIKIQYNTGVLHKNNSFFFVKLSDTWGVFHQNHLFLRHIRVAPLVCC